MLRKKSIQRYAIFFFADHNPALRFLARDIRGAGLPLRIERVELLLETLFRTLSQTIVKPTALGPVANTDTKLLIYRLFQKGRVLARDGIGG